MPWGVSEGGVPQPYRIKVESAHWDKARNRDGELVVTRQGENLMNLTLEGDAYRLIEDEDGFSVGDPIEPVDGKHNRRSFLLGNTSQWVDPREDGKKIESTRGPDEMPWINSEVGRLVNSLVELVGIDTLAEWGPWEESETWAGHIFDLVPTHDVNEDGSPDTYKTRDGDERINWYFIAVAVDENGGGKPKTKTRRRKKSADNGDLESLVKAAYKDFEGGDDAFVDFIQSDEFDGSADLAKLEDDDFDALLDKVL